MSYITLPHLYCTNPYLQFLCFVVLYCTILSETQDDISTSGVAKEEFLLVGYVGIIMVFTGNGEGIESNVSNPIDCEASYVSNLKNHVSLQISTSRKGLLSDEKSPKGFSENPTSLSSRISEDKDEVTSSAQTQGLRKRFKDVMPSRIDWSSAMIMWKLENISGLRKIYCKNGTAKPNERAHMTVVIILLHINCFAQYALCGLNLVAIAAPAAAGLYCVLSPLGKDYECFDDEEAPKQLRKQSVEKRYAFATPDERGIVENKPVWIGGLFSLWEDFCVAYLSIFCCFCVFGWNMERLGFGNMYVHIATFLLFCMAPFWIFNLAAVNIDNDTVREILGIVGIALCFCGLLYGGFWRTQMRKRFNLPPNNLCFGKPNVADCFQWLCCCWCSLAQEVRTGDFYEIVEDGFYRNNKYELHTPLTHYLVKVEGLLNLCLAQSSEVMDKTMMPPNPTTMRSEVENLKG
ncbi:Protein PLANT CADMIUM RESISTANCE 8, partial [Bienertia sinuspersici]